MRKATAHELEETRQLAAIQVGVNATRAGSKAWRAGIESDLRAGDVDRWAREMLRALGWPLALPGARVSRRGIRGTDFHRVRELCDAEETVKERA